MSRRIAALLAATVLSTVIGVAGGDAAQAIVPSIQRVVTTTASTSVSPKMAIAECPFGKSVLGGAAQVLGAEGQVNIQAAFPKFDAGLNKFVYVVKAVEDQTGTNMSWSLTAEAYCTNTTVATIVTGSSLFDSDPDKEATVSCPEPLKVVGMGGLVSTGAGEPAATVGDIPSTAVPLEGFEVNDDLTEVTAQGIEEGGGVLGDFYAGSWKLTAVAACAMPAYFDGLVKAGTKETLGAGNLAQTRTHLVCPEDTRIISAGALVQDYEVGKWHLARFNQYNAFRIWEEVAEANLNPEKGSVLDLAQGRFYVNSICIDIK